MPINPERLRPQRGEKAHQVNTRVSGETNDILTYLAFVQGISRGDLLLGWIGEKIEAETPGLRETLHTIQPSGLEPFDEYRAALDILCPPETSD